MVWWLGIALAFQVVGSLITSYELWQGHRRWHDRFGQPIEMAMNATKQRPTARFEVRVDEAVGGLTTEERLDRIEEQQAEDKWDLINRIDAVSAQIPGAAAEAARLVESRLQQQIGEVLAFLAGMGHRHWWLPWWLGPAFIMVGTLVCGVASVVVASNA